jgi:DNA-directed RNA polymerase subunit H
MKKEQKPRTFNVLDHELVPKHELVQKKEAEQLMAELHIRPHQLPYVKDADPAVVALGGKPGDIVRITRRSPTAGEVVVYRYVIES